MTTREAETGLRFSPEEAEADVALVALARSEGTRLRPLPRPRGDGSGTLMGAAWPGEEGGKRGRMKKKVARGLGSRQRLRQPRRQRWTGIA